METKGKQPIRIDLDQFKLHLNIPGELELSLHFDSPSRRFYLALIALVVCEMKKLGKITSIPMEKHYEQLALLNETVGSSAGSSERKKLFQRIYKKWKEDLSDLEGAPLFKVLGKKREYDGSYRRSYIFTEREKDSWANLFEYKGSKEGVRLRFAIDNLRAGLDDIVLTYGEEQNLTDITAWDSFIENLRENLEDKPDPRIPEKLETKVSEAKVQKIDRPIILKRRTLAVLAVLIFGGALVAFWSISFRTPKFPSGLINESTIELPKKPSIAVLPFANISGDPKEDYLSDGITEQIISALSKTPKLFVIARNSVFTYKGKPVKVQEVSKDLGVRYVLEGSIQKSGDRMRITAQLIDAVTGNHIWGEKFDRDLKDIFALQDDITRNVVMALQVNLTEGEMARLYGQGTDNLEAYLKLMKGVHHTLCFNKNDNEIGQQLFKEAIGLDPGYANGYVVLGWTYRHEAFWGWTKTPEQSREKALELAEKAISLDPLSGAPYALKAFVYGDIRQFDKAIENGKKALRLDPNNADINYIYGNVLNEAGEFKKGIPMLQKAIRLGPIPPWYYQARLGFAYFWTGQKREARVAFMRAVDRSPGNAIAYVALGRALIAAGKPGEAVVEFDKALSLNPHYVFQSRGWYIGSRAVALVGMGKPDEAITTMQDLVSRRPDDADGYRLFSIVLGFEGRYEEALQMAKKAVSLRHGPLDSGALGMSYFMLEQYDQAIAEFKKSIKLWPDYRDAHVWLAAAYSLAGRMEDARAEAAEVLRINPKTSLEDIAKNGFYNYKKADKERFISALRKAGLK